MLINFKSLVGQNYQLEKNGDILISEIRKLLLEEKNVNVSKFCYSGKVLEDKKKLSDYNYTEGNFIIIIPKKNESETKNNIISNESEVSEEEVDNSTLVNATIEVINSNPANTAGTPYENVNFNQENLSEINNIISNPDFINNILNSLGQQFNVENSTDENEQEDTHTNELNEYFENLNLSDTDEQNIDELTNLGFSREEVLQIYIASNKNKEIAANLLIDNQSNQEVN